MRKANIPLVTNHALNASFYSSPQELVQIFVYSIQAVISGTPTGSVYLQASADPLTNNQPPGPTPTNWTTVANSSFTVAAAGTVMWNVTDVGYNWVRVGYTDSSGGASTATMTVTANIKGV